MCQVTFVVDEDYNDTMWCDVVSMDTEDILIGRLWIYHLNGIHGIRTIPVNLFMKKKTLSCYILGSWNCEIEDQGSLQAVMPRYEYSYRHGYRERRDDHALLEI